MSRQDELVTELLSTGLTQHQLTLLVQLLSVMSTRMSGGSRVESPVDAVERRREWDRNYRRKRRAEARVSESGQSTRQVDASCNLSSLSSLIEKEGSKRTYEEVSKKDKISVVERKPQRGTRLPPDAQLTRGDLEFAVALGVTEENARKLWAEFVDYWIGIPGQRGTKLNWSSTWRNRVRDVTGNSGKPGAIPHGKRAPARTVQDSARDLAARVREGIDRFNRPAPGDDRLRDGANRPNVRLLPKG